MNCRLVEPARSAQVFHRLALLLLVLPLLAGCKTDCDKLCDEMASYWEECGLPVGDTAVSDCQEAWESNADDPDDAELLQQDKYKQQCKTLISNEEAADGSQKIALRARFTCRDMCEGPGGNFNGPGGGVDCTEFE
jgi:hypothetical protein